MDVKISNKLFKKYKFLKKKEMPSGFQCGNGWVSILEDMFKGIQDVNPPEDFVITLVEERYGALKIHSKNGNNRTRMVIEDAQDIAVNLCDECGNDKDKEQCPKCTHVAVNYDESVDQ